MSNMIELLQSTNTWVVFSFLIFVGVFIKYGWSVVTSKLDAGIEGIRDNLAQAETLRRDAEAMLADYQARHRDAMNEAALIIARAQEQAATIRAKAEADLQDTLARREKQLQERLARIEASAEAELRAHTAQLALRASEDLIRKSLDAKGQQALIERSIETIKDAA